jgi:hypothetical protein
VPLPPARLTGYVHYDDPGVLDAICETVKKGRPIRLATDLVGVNYETFKAAMYRRPDVATAIAQARAEGSEIWLARLEAAEKDGRSVHGPAWMLGKLYPKAFSEKLVEEDAKNEAPIVEASVTSTTEAGADVEAEPSDEDAMIIAKALLAHRQKKQAEADAAEKGDDDGLV